MQEPKFNPYAALAIGVASVSASAILVKVSSASSGVIAFYRLLFTMLLMLPFFLLKNLPELKVINKKDLFLSIFAGIFLAFHFILWFESLDYTSVASSTVLVTLQPLFAFAGAFLFFKERFSIRAIISGIVAVAGSLVISWGDFQISGLALWGDILSLIACALITAYLLLGQSVRKRISSTTYTFMVYGISTVTLFLYVTIAGESLGPYPTEDWIYFILLAVFPNLLGHSLFNWSLKWLNTTTISMAILMEPVGASILAFFILDEKILWTQVVGGVVIIASLIIFLKDEKKTKAAENVMEKAASSR
ncbi:DMT family transporter [Peribacillus cavernae]|uniref:DMT family transporter n=1 Tax=Peribacillus cavernae TaxID=1674310 RepID=A0A433HC62_9BACI|nr:DMT family transporter [Peribacillus cavernae]MDQ0219574.1 drug/metabolite transporter (DMT)-like permease [Peribacillus cavernae]RUQ25867.1 DMT family transporter [Peribacillus cavernae]